MWEEKNLFFGENPKQAPSGPGNTKEGHKRTFWCPLPEEECETWVPMLPMCRTELKSGWQPPGKCPGVLSVVVILPATPRSHSLGKQPARRMSI